MEFRPCIDIHDGKIKQIVGGSLIDGREVEENYVSEQDGEFFANLYKNHNIKGGHVIILNKCGTDEYEESKKQALKALNEFPGGLQVGGGITPENAGLFLENGASHVIVTSYVFREGIIDFDRLYSLKEAVGKDKLVLDLSCRKKDGVYYVVTDRWQKYTDMILDETSLFRLSEFCDEYLVHAVDVEGKASGVDEDLISLLGGFDMLPITYAGGVHSFEDLEIVRRAGRGKVNVTIGSALDLFGGTMNFDKVIEIIRNS